MIHKYFRGEQLEFEFMKELHPSGLTWQRWEWPYKTEAERELVRRYFKKLEKEALEARMKDLEQSPF